MQNTIALHTPLHLNWHVLFPPHFSIEGIVLRPEQLKGNLEFQNVSFAYPTRKDAPIFQDLSLSVPAGSVMAVVGPSGSGKSTLVSLLLRLYDPVAGEDYSWGHLLQQLHVTVCLPFHQQSSDLEILFCCIGVITIDGHDVRDLNPYWLRSHIGTVSQVIGHMTIISRQYVPIVVAKLCFDMWSNPVVFSLCASAGACTLLLFHCW